MSGETKVKGITRRRALGLAGLAGAAYVAGPLRPFGLDGGAPGPDSALGATCVLAPELTEGPYWVDERLNRSNVIAGQEGATLKLNIYVYRVDDGCAPQQGAIVDIWHCNATGLYSDEAVNGTSGQTWLRGYQETDADGLASFTTIYPGWYSGRTIHIHLRVRTFDGSSTTYDFTSQIFFSEDDNAAVLATSPYSSRPNRDTDNAEDGIYSQAVKAGNVLQPALSGSPTAGYTGTVGVGLSGLPTSAGGAGDDSVEANLTSRRIRNSGDRRELALTIRAEERISANAKIFRGGKAIAHKRIAALDAGKRRLAVPIPNRVAAGSARLELTLRDRAGNRRTLRRSLWIPRA